MSGHGSLGEDEALGDLAVREPLRARITVETGNGALIYATYTGILDLGEDGYQRFLRQEVSPIVPLRSVPRFETAHPTYQWLDRLQCVGIGQGDLQKLTASYDIYALG